MKKNLHLLSLFFLAGAGIVLASCSTDDNAPSPSSEPPAGHEHSYVHHDAVSATCTEAGTIEYYTCSGCDKYFDASKNEIAEANITVAALGHDYGAWVVTTPATDTEQGEETRVCSHDSSHKETRAIMPTGHSFAFSHFEWNANHTSAKAVYTCPHDDVVFKDDATMTSRDTAKCTEPGNIVFTATYGAYHEDQISAPSPIKGHHVVETIPSRSAPDCDHDGWHSVYNYCDVCGAVIESGEVKDSKLGHEFEHYQIKTEATCTTDGELISYCEHGCGEEKVLVVKAIGHVYEAVVTPPTCTTYGFTTHSCKNCDESYIDSYVDPTGHSVTPCVEPEECEYCHQKIQPIGHDFHAVLDEFDNPIVLAADCIHHQKALQRCSRCSAEYYEESGEPHGHDYNTTPDLIRQQEGKSECYQEEVYYCINPDCPHDETSTRIVKFEQHQEKAVILEGDEPTCLADGLKTITCKRDGCEYTKTEPIAKGPEYHHWNLGTPDGDGNRIDECSVCHEHRTVKVMTSAQEVNGDDIAGQNIAVENAASINISQGLVDSLKENPEDTVNVSISVTPVEKSSLNLNSEQSSAIGNNPIYDFSLKSNGSTVDKFNGNKITISLPYEYDPSEDPDEIAVWYIPEGYDPNNTDPEAPKLQPIKATYSNGFITFETDHFSSYTATKLTGEKRCELYGHTYSVSETIPDCLHHKYVIKTCTRCGKEVKEIDQDDKDRVLGHDFEVVASESTSSSCGKSGLKVWRCKNPNCNETYKEVIESASHNWVEQSHQDPTCTENGNTVYHCTNCGEDKTEVLYATGHNFVVKENGVHEATCESFGYTDYVCDHDGCEAERRIYDTSVEPSHDYHKSETKSIAATCEHSGIDFYECSKDSTHTYTVVVPIKAHTPGGSAVSEEGRVLPTCTSDGYHYEVVYCSECHEEISSVMVVDKALGHDWSEWEVVTSPTCTEEGLREHICNRNEDHVEQEVIQATGHTDTHYIEENYVAPTCTEKGHYDKVTVCDACNEEIAREVVEIEALGHTPATAVKENEVAPTCTEEGSYDLVVYCEVCHEELDRDAYVVTELGHNWGAYYTIDEGSCTTDKVEERICANDHNHVDTKVTPCGGHKELAPVKENEVAATCGHEGSYDLVVYCELCGGEVSRETVTVPALDHNWGAWTVTPATCTEDGSRTRVCNDDPNHVETIAIEATGHIEADPVKENEVAPTCTEEGSYDLVVYCEVCGEELDRDTYTIDALGHNYGAWIVTTNPTCTEEGVETRVCARDNTHTETRPVNPTGHIHTHTKIENEVTPTCTEDGSYELVTICDDCKEEINRETIPVSKTGHTWSEWVNVTKLSCTQDLVQQRHCEVCNEPDERTIVVANGHIYETVKENIVAPTCTEDGHHDEVSVCKSCGEHDESTRVTNIVDKATGHTALPEAKENEVAATCTEDGGYDMVVRCEVCHEVLSSDHYVTKATEHNWGAWEVTTPATCTEDGVETRTCTKCGEEETRKIDAIGHSYGAWDVTTPATCETAGVETRVCLHDEKHTETREIAATGHNWGAWEVTPATCTEAGERVRVCSHDEEHIEREVIPALGHTPSQAVIENKVDATCTEDGHYDVVINCSVCGEEISRETVKIDAHGHNYGPVVVVEPTCSEEGSKTRVCSYDETHVDVEVIEKLPHTPKEAVVDEDTLVPATCTEEGHYDSVVYCDVCGEELSRETIALPIIEHSWSEWTEVTPATCIKVGSESRECTVCHKTETREIELAEHVHGEAVIEKEVDPTCTTKGSYDSVVYCDVCGEELSRETTYINPLGHSYEYEGDFNDYHNGTITFTCSECHKEVTKEVKVTASTELVCYEGRNITYTMSTFFNGKSYTVTETQYDQRIPHTPSEEAVIDETTLVPATCEKDGKHDEVHYCTVCHQETSRKTIIDTKLGHSEAAPVRENVVEVTCEKDGYYEEVVYCERCHDELSRERVTVDALGHDYGDWVTVLEPTCEKEGVEARYCSHDHAHQESRLIPKIDHVTGEIQYNTTHHYYVCSVCNTTVNQESHHFHSTISQAATCGADGVQHFECEECGYSYDAAIPMTNAHHYENGVCTVCGKVQDGTCDHSALHIEVIDLEELGYCGGVLKYRTCDCGEVVTINEEDLMDIGCDTSEMIMNQGVEVIDGVSVQYMEARCPTCGFGYKAYAEMVVDGCTQTQNMNIHFPGDGEHEDFLVANLSYSYTNHTNISTKTIAFDGLTAVVTYRQCGKCNEILEVGVVDINEELTINKETYKDSATLTRNIVTYSNDSGSVSIVFTETIDYKSSCLRVTTHSVVVKENGVTKLEKTDKPKSEELHIWETTYELEPGKTCTDGYKAVQTCKTCGLTYKYGGSGHRHNERKTLDFSEYGNGACTSRVDYMECSICHDGYYYNEISGLMRIHPVDYEHATQENITYKGVPAIKMTGVCADCGITVEMISYQKTSGCDEWNVIDITYYDSDENHTKIISFSDNTVNYQSNHDYHYSNVVFDNPELGCEGGVSYDFICTKCGEGRHVDHQTYHTISSEKMETFEVRDASTDNVMIQAYYSTCEVCHKQDVKDMDIRYEFFDSTGRNEVIDGVEHKINVYTNAANNLTVTVDRYEYKEGCYKYIVTSYEVVQNDEVLLSYSNSYRNEDHDFEYHVKFDSPELKCEGGYSGYKVCKDCGETKTIEHENGHRHVHNDINLVEYGACEGTYVHSYECQLCGDSSTYAYHPKTESEYHYYEDHTDQVPHYSYTQHCEDCGYTETVLIETTVNQCETVRKETTHITIGTYDQTFVRQSKSSNHDYGEYTYTKRGKDCEDGLIITATCKKCGEKLIIESNSHYYVENKVDFADLGACGGYYSKHECICCHQSDKGESGYLYVDHEAHKFEGSHNSYTDESGLIHDDYNYVCSECGLVYFEGQTLAPLGKCNYNYTQVRRVTVDGQTFETTSSYTTTRHNYQYEYRPLGEDCEVDGVSVRRYCDECGQEFETETMYSHQTTQNRVDFDKNGFEGAYFTYQECAACHKDAGYNYYFLGEGGTHSSSRTYEGENGVSYYEVTAYNEVTGLKVINTEWEVKVDPCHVIEHETFVFLDRDGNVIYEKELVDKEVRHSYYYTFECEDEENECEGDYIVHEHCYNCDYSSSHEGSTGHVTYETGRVDLTTYGAAQGSYYAYHTCACGYNSSIYLHVTDNLEYRYSEVDLEALPEGAFYPSVEYYVPKSADGTFSYRVTNYCLYDSENSCRYHTYEKYEFGLDADGLNPAHVVTVADSSSVLRHEEANAVKEPATNLEDGGYMIVETEACPRCGQSRVTTSYYDANDNLLRTITRDNYHTYYYEDEVKLITCEYQIFNTVFGPKSLLVSRKTQVEGSESYRLETYKRDPLEPCSYECSETYHYESSGSDDPKPDEGGYAYHSQTHDFSKYIHVDASCTQEYYDGYVCSICGERQDNWNTRYGHDFEYDENLEKYVCSHCGLENETGEEGAIALENIKNDDAYIAGYALNQEIDFNVYFAIVDKESGEETTIERIVPQKHNTLRAYYLDKDVVADYFNANELSQDDYDVRFVFVSNDASDTSIYSLTF